jgi:hypothetical protein
MRDTTVFSEEPVLIFWSSTVLVGFSTLAWVVGFNSGVLYNGDVGTLGFARCVRETMFP